jgi:ABC-type sugar transport system ATPase subunit
MIEVRDLHIHLPAFRLKHISFQVPDNAYCTLMGETGSGKTTILESICGLRRPEQGAIYLNGRDVTRTKPGERNLGYVPQDGSLFPTMRIRDQIEFPLKLRRWKASEISERVAELAELLAISHLMTRKPYGLSGGEQQRAALARSLSFHPQVLCMDEPLSALDESTRARMHDLLRRVHAHEQTTVLHVTHSSTESQLLGTYFLRLVDGVVLASNEGLIETSSQ